MPPEGGRERGGGYHEHPVVRKCIVELISMEWTGSIVHYNPSPAIDNTNSSPAVSGHTIHRYSLYSLYSLVSSTLPVGSNINIYCLKQS